MISFFSQDETPRLNPPYLVLAKILPGGFVASNDLFVRFLALRMVQGNKNSLGERGISKDRACADAKKSAAVCGVTSGSVDYVKT
jgi:hypothetical protein